MEKQGSRKAERQHLKEATVRQSGEEEEKKKQRLSSQNRNRSGRKKAESEGKARRREQKGSTGGTAVGAKPGGMKRNKQKAEYEEPGRKTRETRSERTEKTQEAKAEREHRGSHCEAETGRKRKGRNRGQVARTGTEADERKRKERGKPESESIREAPEEQLRERIREG